MKESLLFSKGPQGISVLVQVLQKHQCKSVELTQILCIMKATSVHAWSSAGLVGVFSPLLQ